MGVAVVCKEAARLRVLRISLVERGEVVIGTEGSKLRIKIVPGMILQGVCCFGANRIKSL